MSMTDMRGADLRGYHASEPEESSSKSKLLAATAVVLGVVAVGAYAYTSHSLLPSTPVKQQSAVNQPVALTPSAQPVVTQPDAVTPAPQTVATPEVQSPAPEIKTTAPSRLVKAKSASTVKAKLTDHTSAVKTAPESETSSPMTSPDAAQMPSAPSQSVTPDTTPSYTAAPSTTQQSAPDTTTTQQPQIQQQAVPDQSAPQ